MRFDDTLETVLASDLGTELGARSAWRQLVDLIGRGRVPADARAMSVLSAIRPSVPPPVRAASARALIGANPPVALVRLFAEDDIAIGTTVLRNATLSVDDWTELLPQLSPAGRAVLRNRSDLPTDVERALESFGSVDFVIASEVTVEAFVAAPSLAAAEPLADLPPPNPPEPSPFVRFAEIARELPVVAEALRRESGPTPGQDAQLFRISDVVARIEAFQRKRDEAPREPYPVIADAPEAFQFESDADGVIRWVEGVSRGSFVGVSLARAAAPGGIGVDGIAAGACRQRARFVDAHLIAGGSAGTWLISAVPAFDAATGRFTGYRGTGRRPRAAEAPGGPISTAPTADSLRQLVHELRTPTNAIVGFAEMIEHQMLGPVPTPYRGHASAILGQARGLLAAIDDLDIAARIEAQALPQSPTAIPLRPLLERLVAEARPIADERRATLALPAADAVVIGDVRAVERLIARLLSTVVAVAARGERITVKAKPKPDGMVAISIDRPLAFANDDPQALFDLDDDGNTGALLGTGFSLRLARNLAAELGGSFVVGDHRLTLRLPDAVDRAMEKARLN